MKGFTAFLLLVTSVTIHAGTQSGYDKICAIYADHEYGGESVGELWFILGEQVSKSVSDIPALQIYSALEEGDPCTRYGVFQEVAEEHLNKSWQCPEMQNLLDLAKPDDCTDSE